MSQSGQTYGWVMSRIWITHVTHMTESCHTYEWPMSQEAEKASMVPAVQMQNLAKESKMLTAMNAVLALYCKHYWESEVRSWKNYVKYMNEQNMNAQSMNAHSRKSKMPTAMNAVLPLYCEVFWDSEVRSWMSHVTHMNEQQKVRCSLRWMPCRLFTAKMLMELWGARMDESYHTYKWVTSCHSFEWAMPHIWISKIWIGHRMYDSTWMYAVLALSCKGLWGALTKDSCHT